MAKMWEILVPTQMLNINDEMRPIKTRYHRVWDAKVRAITGGLTILTPAKGHWISPDKELFVEKMIPVRIVCEREQMIEISDMTAKYYRQEAILFYRVSDEVEIRHYGKLPHQSTPKKGKKGGGTVKAKRGWAFYEQIGKIRDCPHSYTSRSACFRCTNEDNGGVEFAPEGPNEEDFDMSTFAEGYEQGWRWGWLLGVVVGGSIGMLFGILAGAAK